VSDRLSVLVPVYNEERTIERVIGEVLDLGPLVLEIVVVDDHSTDRTPEILQRLSADDSRIRVMRQPQNAGKTAAIRQAISLAKGGILVVQDADLEYSPAEIPALVRPILEGNADVVYGSRFLVRREARVLYFYHYLANKGLTFLSNLLTNHNMTDVETGYKAFRACVLKPFELTSKGFGMEIELTALVCKTKARIYETPISYYGRTYEEGKKISLKDGLWALWYIAYYNLVSPWHASRRRYIQTVNESLSARQLSVAKRGTE
jgi:glycosyltransferase involved in cell wall biosynthesis